MSSRSVTRLFGGNSSSACPRASSLLAGGKKEIAATLLPDERPAQVLALDRVPGPRPSLPLIGTAWQYLPGGRYSLSKLHESHEDKYRRYGPVVREEFQWRRPVVHLYNPEDYEAVFRVQGPRPTRAASDFLCHYRRSRPDKYANAGLANMEGADWERARKILGQVLLKPKALDFLTANVNEIADDFVTLLRSSRNPTTHTIDSMQEFAYRMALESVYMMSLDTRLGCLDPNLRKNTPAHDMILSVKLLFDSFQELFFGLPFWKLFRTPAYKKLDRAETLMYNATSKQIDCAMEKLKNTSDIPKQGVLNTLLQTKEFSDIELKTQIIDLIEGGIFTVANAVTFLIDHLSRNLDVQEKLYQELKTVMPDTQVTNERLDNMPYMKACVKESFRLSSTIPSIVRILSTDIVLSGYHIPAGTPLFCNFTVPCRQPDKFPDPDRFWPDRWIQKTTRIHNPFTLIPFGFGSRMCIGRRFAETEIYTTVAKIISHFKLEGTGKEATKKSAFIVVPSSPVSVALRDR